MYNTLKSEHLAARKAREEGSSRAALLVGVISDIDDVCLSKRKESEALGTDFIVPDHIVVAVLKSQIKNIRKAADDIITVRGDCPEATDFIDKANSLSMFLPQAIAGDELRMLIQELGANNLGQAMGLLKKASVSQGFDYDGQEASVIAKELYL